MRRRSAIKIGAATLPAIMLPAGMGNVTASPTDSGEKSLNEPKYVGENEEYELYLHSAENSIWAIKVDKSDGSTMRGLYKEGSSTLDMEGLDGLDPDDVSTTIPGVIEEESFFMGYIRECRFDDCDHWRAGSQITFNEYVSAVGTAIIAGEIMAVLRGVKYLGMILNSDRIARILGAVGGVSAGDTIAIGSYHGDVHGFFKRTFTGYAVTKDPTKGQIIPMWPGSGHKDITGARGACDDG